MSIANLLTIDFEEWYQGLTSTSAKPEAWPQYESRLERQADWLLDTLAEHGVRATFFVLGQVARDHPHLVRRIASAGHELGAHGDRHQRVDHMTRAGFRADVLAAADAIQEASGVRPTAYRAPCFSIGRNTPWVWDELERVGIRIDSSVFPIWNPLYGMPGATRDPYSVSTANGAVREFPLSTIRVAGVNLPFSGGFYFRMLPYALVQALTRRLNARGRAVLFYFHPWEFDPDHPVPECVTARERLSHYGGLVGLRAKFSRLLRDFRFANLSSIVPC